MTRAGGTPITALADRKNAIAAAMSRFLAQPDVDKGTRTIDGTIKIAPSTVHLDVCLVGNLPALARSALYAAAGGRIDEGRRQLRLPIANRLIAEFDSRIRNISWQIAQAQLVAKPPKDHECDDVGWILSAIENSTAAFMELLTTGAGHRNRR